VTKAIFEVRFSRHTSELGLFAIDAEGADLLAAMRLGREVVVEVKQARNPKHHRLYWAMIRFIRMHSPVMAGFPEERIHEQLKLRCGLFEQFIDLESGKVITRVGSIAWESMDQTSFNIFFDNAVEVILRWMPPRTTAQAIRAEILEMVSPRGA
jgi:hypothetical protein